MLPCCLKLRESMSRFSPMEQQIARFILDDPDRVSEMSIEELARACNTSVSSVVRLCKSAQYAGYKAFLRTLSADIALARTKDVSYTDVRPGSSLEDIVNYVASNSVQAIENTRAVLDLAEMEKAVAAVCAASRIDFYGNGASGLVALDAHSKFIRMGKTSMSSNDFHQQMVTAALLCKGDVAVLISYSGDTKNIIEIADIIKRTDATIISLTRSSENELSACADIRLHCSTSEQLVRSGPMVSRLGSMIVLDMLYTAVVSRLYSEVRPQLDRTLKVTRRSHLNPLSI